MHVGHALLLAGLFALGAACGGSAPPPAAPPTPASPPPPPATAPAPAPAAADAPITAENADAVAKALEAEIDADKD